MEILKKTIKRCKKDCLEAINYAGEHEGVYQEELKNYKLKL